jgi:accessory gene regulator protein AgrB
MQYKKLIRALINRKLIAAEDADIYVYGLNYAFLYLVNLLISALFAVCLGNLLVYVLFLIFFLPLRRVAGGMHFSNAFVCMLFSQLCILLPQLLVSYFEDFSWIYVVIYFMADCFLLYMIRYRRAPENPNRYYSETLLRKSKQSATILTLVYPILFVISVMLQWNIVAYVLLYITALEFIAMGLPEIKYWIDYFKNS